MRDERLRSHHRENYYQWDVRRAFAPSPPPQPALDRIAADADESERRGVEWRERALRAEEEVAGLTKRLENASKTIAAYQDATGTDYPGSLRAHQRIPDLLKAGRAYREQWGIAEAVASEEEARALRLEVAALKEAQGELLDVIYDGDYPICPRCHDRLMCCGCWWPYEERP